MTSYRLKTLVTCPLEKSDGTPTPFVGLEDIRSGTGSLVTEELPEKSALDSVLYRPGDVLFGKLRPYLAKSFLAGTHGSATGELLVLRSRGEIEPRFLFYSTLSSPWLEWAEATSYGTKMPRTSWEAMSEYRFELPSSERQRRIDELVRLRNLQVDRLAEALRNEAIRIRGTDWNLLPLRRVITSVQTGTTPTELLLPADPDNIPWYTPAVLSETLDLYNADKSVSKEEFSAVPRFPAGSILIVGIGESLGKVAELDHEATGNQQLTAITISNSADRRFVLWRLFAAYEEIRAWAQYSRVRILNNEVLKSFQIPVPGLEEQTRVRGELDQRLAEFLGFRDDAARFAQLAGERRQALITAAVTGGITV